jgi:hypothetical protein
MGGVHVYMVLAYAMQHSSATLVRVADVSMIAVVMDSAKMGSVLAKVHGLETVVTNRWQWKKPLQWKRRKRYKSRN